MRPPSSFETGATRPPQDEADEDLRGFVGWAKRSGPTLFLRGGLGASRLSPPYARFFKRAAKRRRVSYQRMSRALVDAYAGRQEGK